MRKLATIKSDPSGLVTAVSNVSLKQIPYWLMTDSPNNIITVTPNGQVGPIAMTVSRDGPGEVVNFSVQHTPSRGVATAQVLFEIDDGSNILALSNAPLHIDTVCGDGTRPYILPNAINVSELRKLRVTLTDLSGLSNDIRILGQCFRPMIPEKDYDLKKSRAREASKDIILGCYFYTTNGGPITVGAGVSEEIAIDIDQTRHFKLMQMSAVSTGSFTMDIMNGQTGESLIDAPSGQHYQIANNLLFGNGYFPFKFQGGRMFERGQKILLKVTDTSGSRNDIYVTLAGQFIQSQMWRA
jgi:hypothetical protein